MHSPNNTLTQFADTTGVVRILALDHESSLRRVLAPFNKSGDADDDMLIKIKKLIVEELAAHVRGLLMDPLSWERCRQSIPADTGVMVKIECGWHTGGPDGVERLTTLSDKWPITRLVDEGVKAIKLMIYYHPAASTPTLRRQEELAQAVGNVCAQRGVLYCLEPTNYRLTSSRDESDEPRVNAPVVIESVREFAKAKYQADVLKVDFPADLRFATGYTESVFDGRTRTPLYDLAAVRAWCTDLDEACGRTPWVIMSSGASNEEFVQCMTLARDAGSTGYICGQGIWNDALKGFPHLESIRFHLANEAVRNVRRLNGVFERAPNRFLER